MSNRTVLVVIDPWYSDQYCILEDTQDNRQLLQQCQLEYGTPLKNWTHPLGKPWQPVPSSHIPEYERACRESWPATHRLFDSGEFTWHELPPKGSPIFSSLGLEITVVVLLCNEW